MSSELTIDIQLTELGFSSWDFQVLKQKETHQASEPEYASASSSSSSSSAASSSSTTTPSSSLTTTSSLCSIPVKILVDEETNVGHFTPVVCPNPVPSDKGSRVNASSLQVHSTESSLGESSKTGYDKNKGHVMEKTRKCPWYDENADEQLKEDKKKKISKDPRKKEQFSESLMGADVSVEDEEEENDDEEDEADEDDGDDDGDLTEDEEFDDLSSDTNGSEEHRCQVCSIAFSTAFLLHEHLHVHNGVRLYRCAECGKQFCHLANYRKHLRSHAQASAIRCIVCTAQFTTQEDLQHHLDTNHFEDKFYQCDLCKRIFTSLADCKTHVQTHRRRPKRYPCPKCERSFRHHSSMLYHLKRHNKGVFVCTDCGLAFSTKAVLLRHSFHHLGLLPYTCIRCKRHFRLSSHYMKHECKPEQLQCVACLVIFQSQADFMKHKKDTGCWGHQMALNTKTNDIRCMECGQVFNSSEELKKHAGTHQRVMKCSECGMGFRSSIMLMSHMGGHAATRPCLCKECGLGFCHQQAYDSHRKTCGLVNPTEIAAKKQKANLKKEAVTAPKKKAAETVPQPLLQPKPLPPTAVVSAQTKPVEALTTFTLNKEPLSPVSVVMLLPLPSTPASECIQNPQNLNSPASKKTLPARQVIHVPLSSSNCSIHKESDKTVLLKDIASPVPGSSILIPLTSVTNGKTEWTVLETPCTSGSLTKAYTPKKENEQDVKSKPILNIPQLSAKNEQIKKVLSNLEIQQVLSMMKKTCDQQKGNLSTLPTAVPDNAEVKADDGKQLTGLQLVNSNPSHEKSNDACLTINIERDSAEKVQSDTPDSSAVSLKPDVILTKNSVQKAEGRELSAESDVVQCDTCGEIVLEKNFIQHNMKHTVSSVLATS